MYKKYLYNVEERIKNIDLMFAHTSENEERENEKLLDHLHLVMEKLEGFNNENRFIDRVKELVADILIGMGANDDRERQNSLDFIVKAFLNAVYLHDIGKCSIGFQYGRLENINFASEYSSSMNTDHSLYSARIYLDFAMEDAIEYSKAHNLSKNTTKFLIYIVSLFSYSIVKHHGSLDSFNSFINNVGAYFTKFSTSFKRDIFIKSEDIEELSYYNGNNCSIAILKINDLKKTIDKMLDKVSREIYLLNKILFSVLVSADSIATTEYMDGSVFKTNFLNIEETMERYKNTPLYKNIQKHFKEGIFDGTINKVRCDIFKNTEDALRENIDKNILYLESPTGSGKTNTVTNLAFTCIDISKGSDNAIKRFVYTAPFNTITTQTAKFLNDLVGEKDVVEVNSETAIRNDSNDKGESLASLSLLDYQMMNYPITLTSHVKLFSLLFGTSRMSSHGLVHLFNSIIIVDEIQAYSPKIWARMIKLLNIYSKYMNIKFIIMSATLPKISRLIDDEVGYGVLLKNSEDYFENKYFKDRINKYNFDMLSDEYRELKLKDKDAYKEKCFNSILSRIREEYKENKNSKILVEFITKKSCREFYDFIKEANLILPIKDELLPIKEITSEDNSFFKAKVLDMVKSLDSIILISTQCIEAGVDINMDIGFKDISYIDNEEQFLGRIRREYDESKKSEAIFFDLDDADGIYSVTGEYNYKKGFNILNSNYRKLLKEKKFNFLFEELLLKMRTKQESKNSKTSFDSFDFSIKIMDYKAIAEDLTLIEDKNNEYTLYIPFDITTEDFVGSGKEVWREFKDSLKIKNYAEKKIEISRVKEKMNYFCYKYTMYGKGVDFGYSLNSKGITFEERAGVYYLELDNKEISNFIDDEFKFNKEKFNIYSSNLII